ncbi:MAG TPA: putative Ig domain-containing protein [Planctomycetota bacterium]
MITSATADSFQAGQQYTYQIAALNNPTSYNALSLPAGLSVNTNNGVISGTSNVPGTYTVTLVASNSAGTGNAELKLTVSPVEPAITSPLFANGALGVPFRFDIVATGIPAPTITLGTLPPGLQFNGTSISGTPVQSGTTFVDITATNAAGSVTKSLKITVVSTPVVTGPLLIAGTLNQALTNYNVTILPGSTGNAAAAPVFAVVSGPVWLSVDPTTGSIAGTPTAAGTFSAVFRVSVDMNMPDGSVFNAKATATATVAISQVAGAPAITSPATAEGQETVPFIYGVTATNAPTSFALGGGSGPLPGGLTLDAATGVIAGVPSILPSGLDTDFPVTIVAHNSSGDSVATPLTITIRLAIPVITNAADQAILTTKLFQYQASATTFTDPTVGVNHFSVVFAPPIPSNNLSMADLSGLLSGTPEQTTDVGIYTVTLTVSNLRGSSSTDFQLTIADESLLGSTIPAQITSPSQAVAVQGVPFTYQITAIGAGAFRVFPGGTSLPPHLVFDLTTGLISGTCQPADVGTYDVILSAGEMVGTPAFYHELTHKTLTIFVRLLAPPPVPPAFTLTTARGTFIGSNVDYTVTTTPDYTDPLNAQVPLLFSARGLPQGLALTPDQIATIGGAPAKISGIPLQAGTTLSTLSVINAAGSDTSGLLFTIASVSIVSPLTATGSVGVPFSYRILGSGGPNEFGAANLPAGLTVDTRTGIISGIPVDTHNVNPVDYSATISASNGRSTGTATLKITINPRNPAAPDITSPLAVTGAETVSWSAVAPFTYQLTASNSPTSFGAEGLPDGLFMNPATGVISGTPTLFGVYNVPVTATNASGTDAEILVITINQIPPTITSPLNVTGLKAQLFVYQIQTTGSQPQQYDAAPLPAWLTLNSNVLSGTPPDSGLFSFTISASNQASTATKTLNITVMEPPVFTAPAVPAAVTTVGDSSFKLQFDVTGFPPPILTVDPASLAGSGITFVQGPSANKSATGIFTGTPLHTLTVTVFAENAANAGQPVSQVYKIQVNPVTITSPLTLSGNVNTPISPYTITATGNPNSFTAIGLPSDLALNGASISGTPIIGGTTEVTISASNGVGSATATLVIGISSPAGSPAILSNLVLTGVKGTPLTYTIVASNNPTTFGASNLPPGLNPPGSTNFVSGTPTTSGSTQMTVSATNTIGTGTADVVVAISDVQGGPAITSPLKASAFLNTAFTYQITSVNGPISNFGASGLPPGLQVDINTGVIQGTVTSAAAVGTYPVSLSATNNLGTSPPAVLLLTVFGAKPIAPVITSTPLDITAILGQPFTPYNITATNVATTIAASNLPPGLSLAITPASGATGASGVISGTPTAIGDFVVPLSASNGGGEAKVNLVIHVVSGAAKITSPLTAAGMVGVPFTYTIVAAGLTPIEYSASPLPPGLTLSGNVISGVPTLQNVFIVNLNVSNAFGPADTETLTISIAEMPDDLDGDGFPNELEKILGTDPGDPNSTPFGPGAKAGVIQALNITSLQVRLDFKSASSTKDQIQVNGTLPLGPVDLSGKAVTVVAGGAKQNFTLNSRGTAADGQNRIMVKSSAKSEDARFTVKLAGNLKAALAQYSDLTNKTQSNQSKQIRIWILLNNTVYESRKLVTYNAKQQKTGVARATKVDPASAP